MEGEKSDMGIYKDKYLSLMETTQGRACAAEILMFDALDEIIGRLEGINREPVCNKCGKVRWQCECIFPDFMR
jgi:hypothetical protein